MVVSIVSIGYVYATDGSVKFRNEFSKNFVSAEKIFILFVLWWGKYLKKETDEERDSKWFV